jgi:hypothetical protein
VIGASRIHGFDCANALDACTTLLHLLGNNWDNIPIGFSGFPDNLPIFSKEGEGTNRHGLAQLWEDSSCLIPRNPSGEHGEEDWIHGIQQGFNFGFFDYSVDFHRTNKGQDLGCAVCILKQLTVLARDSQGYFVCIHATHQLDHYLVEDG